MSTLESSAPVSQTTETREHPAPCACTLCAHADFVADFAKRIPPLTSLKPNLSPGVVPTDGRRDT